MLTEMVEAVDGAIAAYAALLEAGEADPVVPPFGRLSEWPSDVVSETGRPYTVVLSSPGGPHIEVVADGRWPARLNGFWGSSTLSRHGDYLSIFLDYFISRG